MVHIKTKDDLIETGKFLLEMNLAWGNSGNMSARSSNHNMLITGSGTNMGNLSYDDIVFVDIKTGEWIGEKKPSKEIPMHRAIYNERSDANVIIHSSPFWSTLVACSDTPVYSELFIESMYYLKDIGYVEYFHPGSEELGNAIGNAAKNSSVLFMKNHGIIVFDDSFPEAKMKIETVELTCKMIAMSRAANINLSHLPQDTVKDFLENSGYKKKVKV